MSTQHEIILIDGGDQVTPGGGATETAPMVAPPVNPRVEAPGRCRGTPNDAAGPIGKQRSANEPSTAQSAAALMKNLTDALGGNQLTSAASQLSRVFNDVSKNAEALGRGLTTPAASPQVSAPSAAPAQVSGPAPDQQPAISPAPSRSTTISLPTRNVDIQRVLPAPAARSPVGVTVPKPVAITAPAAGGATAAEGMAALAKFAGPAAIAVAGLTAAVAAGVMAVKAFDGALMSEANRLENLSGDISVAASQSQVRSELADLRRAERIGPDVGRFMNARDKLSEASAKVMDEIYALMAKIAAEATPAILATAASVELLATHIAENFLKLELGVAALRQDMNRQIEVAGQLGQNEVKQQQALHRLLSGEFLKDDDKVDSFTDSFLAQFGNVGEI